MDRYTQIRYKTPQSQSVRAARRECGIAMAEVDEDPTERRRRGALIKGLIANEAFVIARITELREKLVTTRLHINWLSEEMAPAFSGILGKDQATARGSSVIQSKCKATSSEPTQSEHSTDQALGFCCNTLDNSEGPAAYLADTTPLAGKDKAWRDLNATERSAAMLLGFQHESWNGERCRTVVVALSMSMPLLALFSPQHSTRNPTCSLAPSLSSTHVAVASSTDAHWNAFPF